MWTNKQKTSMKANMRCVCTQSIKARLISCRWTNVALLFSALKIRSVEIYGEWTKSVASPPDLTGLAVD